MENNKTVLYGQLFGFTFSSNGKNFYFADAERTIPGTETRARQYGEMLGSAVASVATVIDYPIGL